MSNLSHQLGRPTRLIGYNISYTRVRVCHSRYWGFQPHGIPAGEPTALVETVYDNFPDGTCFKTLCAEHASQALGSSKADPRERSSRR